MVRKKKEVKTYLQTTKEVLLLSHLTFNCLCTALVSHYPSAGHQYNLAITNNSSTTLVNVAGPYLSND